MLQRFVARTLFTHRQDLNTTGRCNFEVFVLKHAGRELDSEVKVALIVSIGFTVSLDVNN